MTAWFKISHERKIVITVFCSTLNLAFLDDVEMVAFVTFMQDVLTCMEFDDFESIDEPEFIILF